MSTLSRIAVVPARKPKNADFRKSFSAKAMLRRFVLKIKRIVMYRIGLRVATRVSVNGASTRRGTKSITRSDNLNLLKRF